MNEEKRMAGNYEIIHSVYIGDREIVVGEDLANTEGNKFMCAYCRPALIYAVYDDVMGSDDYAEIIQLFGERVAEQAAKTREMFNDLRLEGQDVSPLTIKDCTPITGDDDLHNKVIVIKPDKLRREYQKANYQLKLCTGGFGASPKSRGNACFCVDLFSGEKSRFERYEVMGTLKEEQLPKWARDGLEAYWHKKQHEQRLQGKPKKVEMER